MTTQFDNMHSSIAGSPEGKVTLFTNMARGGVPIAMQADARVGSVMSANEQGLARPTSSKPRHIGRQGTGPCHIRPSVANVSRV